MTPPVSPPTIEPPGAGDDTIPSCPGSYFDYTDGTCAPVTPHTAVTVAPTPPPPTVPMLAQTGTDGHALVLAFGLIVAGIFALVGGRRAR